MGNLAEIRGTVFKAVLENMATRRIGRMRKPSKREEGASRNESNE